MKNNLQQKSGNYQAVVYNDFDGTPLKVTFLGNRWWVTTPGERLLPLKEYFDDEHINFNFLCNPKNCFFKG